MYKIPQQPSGIEKKKIMSLTIAFKKKRYFKLIIKTCSPRKVSLITSYISVAKGNKNRLTLITSAATLNSPLINISR